MRLPVLALATLTACGGASFGPPMPVALAPVEAGAVASWVAATAPDTAVRLRFQWSYRDEKGDAGGRGSAVILRPDSLRFDFRGPLGQGSGAAMVVGDAKVWAMPEDEVDKLVPNYPILWAMLGRARLPEPGAALSAVEDDRLTAWRYAVGADTVDYILTKATPRQLIVDVRHAGTRLGRVATTLDPAGLPSASHLEVPSAPSRLRLTFYEAGPLATRPADLWQEPRDDP